MKKLMTILMMIAIVPALVFASGAEEQAGGPVIEFATNFTEEGAIDYFGQMAKELMDEYNAQNGTDYVLKYSPAQGMDITNTRMSSNDRPDIFLIDSPADAQRYAADGLLMDLTATAEKYNWKERMFDWAYDLALVDGKVMSLPMGYEGIVIWYDKVVADQLGIDCASISNLQEFEAALQKAQDNDFIPIMLGTQDWPWAQEWYLSIMYSYTGREQLKETVEGNGSWTAPEYKETVELYKKWHDCGFLANGKSYILPSADAINAFTTHQCLFKLEGTWATYWIQPLSAEEQANIGVMLHPAINDRESAHLPLAIGGNYCASVDAKEHEDVVGFLINGLLEQRYQGGFLQNGMDLAPIVVDDEQYAGLTPTIKEMWNLVNGALANGDYGYTTYAFYPPETRVYSYEGIVDVMEGNITVDQYLEKLQALNTKELEAGFIPMLP